MIMVGRKKKKHEPQQINCILHTEYSSLTAKYQKIIIHVNTSMQMSCILRF